MYIYTYTYFSNREGVPFTLFIGFRERMVREIDPHCLALMTSHPFSQLMTI
jgi:hypothetical protein